MYKEVIFLFINEQFHKRLAELRTRADVSARDMSLTLGQSESYISNIENGHNLPSMSTFFYICDYLKVTPKEFFDLESSDPTRLTEITEKLKRLNPEQLALVSKLVMLATGYSFAWLWALLLHDDGSATLKPYYFPREDYEEDLAWLAKEEEKFMGYLTTGRVPPAPLVLPG